MRPPEFWYAPPSAAGLAGAAAAACAPAAAAVAAAGLLRRAAVRPWRAPVPVICVGNIAVGGTGKTPAALALAASLRARGRTPHLLTRGHGGRRRGPVRVDADADGARLVGDEPLLLARAAPTWVARDRAAGARAAVADGADVIVMDDGFQNPGLFQDVSLVMVDGGRGFGNGRVLPAGPLREPVDAGLARAAAVVIVGDDERGAAARIGIPRLTARLVPAPECERLAGAAVAAFAGIGRPGKFFATLEMLGCRIVSATPFPDHHRYRPDEIMGIVEAARAARATPVTTEKDMLNLPPEARPMVTPVPVMLAWDDEAALGRILAPALDR